jgi:hypothetical protein
VSFGAPMLFNKILLTYKKKTFECVLPKKNGVVEIKNFHPISLVGSVYKIISRVCVNRLKLVLHKIVSSSQNAFIQGRHFGFYTGGE